LKTQTTNRHRLIQVCLVLAALIVGVIPVMGATPGSHYPIGGEGVMAAAPPPPGVYVRTFNTWTNPAQEMDDNGDPIDNDFNLSIFSSAQRFIYVTNYKILGADYIMSMVVPMVDKDLSIGAAGLNASQRGLGDMVFEPLALHWGSPRYDVIVAAAAILPTGKFEVNKPASLGLGYSSAMITIGGTAYLDQGRKWSVSALTRNLINGEQKDSEITPGSEFMIEGGIGYETMRPGNFLIRPGIAFCAYVQTGEDDGDLANDLKKESYAAGPEFNMFWLDKGFQINVRYLEEFGAKNTAEGSQFVLTLTKGL